MRSFGIILAFLAAAASAGNFEKLMPKDMAGKMPQEMKDMMAKMEGEADCCWHKANVSMNLLCERSYGDNKEGVYTCQSCFQQEDMTNAKAMECVKKHWAGLVEKANDFECDKLAPKDGEENDCGMHYMSCLHFSHCFQETKKPDQNKCQWLGEAMKCVKEMFHDKMEEKMKGKFEMMCKMNNKQMRSLIRNKAKMMSGEEMHQMMCMGKKFHKMTMVAPFFMSYACLNMNEKKDQCKSCIALTSLEKNPRKMRRNKNRCKKALMSVGAIKETCTEDMKELKDKMEKVKGAAKQCVNPRGMKRMIKHMTRRHGKHVKFVMGLKCVMKAFYTEMDKQCPLTGDSMTPTDIIGMMESHRDTMIKTLQDNGAQNLDMLKQMFDKKLEWTKAYKSK